MKSEKRLDKTPHRPLSGSDSAEEKLGRRTKLLEWLNELRQWLALILAVIAMFLGLLTKKELRVQGDQLERLENCEEKQFEIRIESPSVGSQIPTSGFDVTGTSTLHERCRYVFLVVRGVSSKVWEIADLVQVNKDGRWAARIDLNRANISAGEQFDVDARVTAQADAYRIDQVLETPPQRGVPSNIVRMRRVQ